MIHWLHSLFPHLQHHGYGIVFIVTFLNSVGFPFPVKPFLFGAGFILEKEGIPPWESIAAGTTACFLGGLGGFWLGRRLALSRLERIHWLHLTPQKFERMKSIFKRHGDKAVFIARFIPLFPSLISNVLAGMTKMRWRVFLFYHLTGSAAYTGGFILLGYLFGKQWKILETWLGPTGIYLILGGAVLAALIVVFRRFFYNLWAGFFYGKRKQGLGLKKHLSQRGH
jgi:membrane protein DedA with SNARE-associated domain